MSEKAKTQELGNVKIVATAENLPGVVFTLETKITSEGLDVKGLVRAGLGLLRDL